MPEGPECRRYSQSIAERVSGKTIKSIKILSGRYKDKPPGGFNDFCNSLPVDVVGVGVHGKFIYWILKNELSIWCTLGMTGGWSEEATKHSRVTIELNDGFIFFNDMRNFGTLKFVRGKYRLIEKLTSLGPDMLAEDVPDEIFIKRLREYNKWPITNAIMSQGVISGVGNYIKAESLWLAKISPHRRVVEMTDTELCTLNASIKRVMRESFESGGATIKTYKDFSDEAGEYARKFLVYNQKTDPEGNPVVREKTSDKRTTHWCPKVQT